MVTDSDLADPVSIAGPAPTASEDAPPSWLTDEGGSDAPPESESSSKSKVSQEDLQEGAEIFVEGIAYLHDMAAEHTGYGGFSMTPRRTKLWTRSLKFILKHVKVEKWPEMMAVMWLGLDESLMIIGYFMWKKEQSKHQIPSEKPT